MIFHRLVIEFTTKLRSARFHGVTLPSAKTIWYVMFYYIYVSSAVFVLSRAIIRIPLTCCMASASNAPLRPEIQYIKKCSQVAYYLLLCKSNIYWIHVVGYGCMEFRTKKFFGLMCFHLIIVESLTCEIHSILDDSLV